MRRLLAFASTLTLVACNATSDIPVQDFSSLVRNLQGAGYTVESDPNPSDALYPGFPESRVLVEDEPMQVYTFNTPEQATYGVSLISADGSKVDQNPVNREKPVFYSKDTIIVVFSQEDTGLNAYLTTILGPSVYPKVAPAPSSAASSTGSGAIE